MLYPKGPNPILSRNLARHGRDNLDNILGENWKKYCIGEDGSNSQARTRAASLDRSGTDTTDKSELNKAYPNALPGPVFIKKKSNQATITDLRSRSLRNAPGPSGVAVEDPGFEETASDKSGSAVTKQKKDSETNTDHSVQMMKGSKAGGRPQAAGGPGGFGYRKAGSAPATGKSGSKSASGKIAEAEAMKGERLSNYNKGSVMVGGNPEKKKVSSNTQTNISTVASSVPSDYQSNTLGRRRPDPNLKEKLFGSRSSLNKVSTMSPHDMIISNPHATFSKRHSGGSAGSGGSSDYVNIGVGNYLSPEYVPTRPLSGISSPSSSGYTSWPKTGVHGLPPGLVRTALSETESMESLSSAASSSIQAQIQQARALSLASRSIMQHANNNHTGLHRSDSFKSTKSEKVFPTSNGERMLQRTNSYSQLTGGASSPGSPTGLSPGNRPMVTMVPAGSSYSRPSSTVSSSSPYANVFLPLSKMAGSRDDDCKYRVTKISRKQELKKRVY